MSEFNLIDSSYQRRRNKKCWLVGFAASYVALLMVLGFGRASLLTFIEDSRAEIETLQSDTESILSRKRALRDLQEQKAQLQHRLAVLEGLVEGPDIEQIFYAVEQSLNDDTWFVGWSFRRAGELVEVDAEEVNTGYFIIVSENSDQQKQAWKIRTHMEIKAQAISHSALAGFVRQLSNQPAVEHVQIESTRTQNVGTLEVIHFSLAVVLNTSRSAGA